jgi:hypothetical protein
LGRQNLHLQLTSDQHRKKGGERNSYLFTIVVIIDSDKKY